MPAPIPLQQHRSRGHRERTSLPLASRSSRGDRPRIVKGKEPHPRRPGRALGGDPVPQTSRGSGDTRLTLGVLKGSSTALLGMLAARHNIKTVRVLASQSRLRLRDETTLVRGSSTGGLVRGRTGGPFQVEPAQRLYRPPCTIPTPGLEHMRAHSSQCQSSEELTARWRPATCCH